MTKKKATKKVTKTSAMAKVLTGVTRWEGTPNEATLRALTATFHRLDPDDLPRALECVDGYLDETITTHPDEMIPAFAVKMMGRKGQGAMFRLLNVFAGLYPTEARAVTRELLRRVEARARELGYPGPIKAAKKTPKKVTKKAVRLPAKAKSTAPTTAAAKSGTRH